MDIKNINSSDSQSFGMAFIRPKSTDYIKHFFRVRSKRLPKDELIELGLRQLEKEHINDKHFDFMYNEGAFPQYFGLDTIVISPKSPQAKDMVQTHVTMSSAMQIPNKYEDLMYEVKNFKPEEIKSPVKRFIAKVKLLNKVRKTIKYLSKNPKELLPDNLREASEYVTKQEKLLSAKNNLQN